MATIEFSLKCYQNTCSLRPPTAFIIDVPDEDINRPLPDEQTHRALIKIHHELCQYCNQWNKIEIWKTWNTNPPTLANQIDTWDGIPVYQGEPSDGPSANMADQAEGQDDE